MWIFKMDYQVFSNVCVRDSINFSRLSSAGNLRLCIVNTETGTPGKQLLWPFSGISGGACSYPWLSLQPQRLPATYTSSIKHGEENSSWTYFQFVVQTVQISCNLSCPLRFNSIWFGDSVLSRLNWTWNRTYIGQVCSPDFIPMFHLHMPLDC